MYFPKEQCRQLCPPFLPSFSLSKSRLRVCVCLMVRNVDPSSALICFATNTRRQEDAAKGPTCVSHPHTHTLLSVPGSNSGAGNCDFLVEPQKGEKLGHSQVWAMSRCVCPHLKSALNYTHQRTSIAMDHKALKIRRGPKFRAFCLPTFRGTYVTHIVYVLCLYTVCCVVR